MSVLSTLSMIFGCFFLAGVIGACWFRMLKKNKRVMPKDVNTVTATVIDKYRMPIAPNTYGAFSPMKFVVVFLVENEKIAFEVSEYSFGSYVVDESGTLKYCGNEIIDFR